MRKPWNLGNTTVRSPFRLREGLIALSGSILHGNLDGSENELAFAKLLHDKGVLCLKSLEPRNIGIMAPPSSTGRKWRAALSQMGFIVHQKAPSYTDKWKGKENTLTANGRRLIDADTVPAMQECFLRALAAYHIPSCIESSYEFKTFSPLQYVLAILIKLEDKTGSSRLYQREIGQIIQLSDSSSDASIVVDLILAMRAERESAQNKRKFDNDKYDQAAEGCTTSANTLRDYADSNSRYLKSTGLVQSKGKGIAIVPEKKLFIEHLLQHDNLPASKEAYFNMLFNGAALPTDNIEEAQLVVEDLIVQLNNLGKTVEAQEPLDDVGLVNNYRYSLEEQLFQLKEIDYAATQVDLWEDIAAYLQAISTRANSFTLPSTQEKESIPRNEMPAYFEWAVWRAFLAINSLVKPPYESRRFRIDQDFKPVAPAPGGGADIIFEFQDTVIIGEVTLTESSRQEAAEGEPVRRHVASYMQKYKDKAVYGLFIANKIDTNTAETFRYGIWYLPPDDERLSVDIIPITLEQFHGFFVASFKYNNAHYGNLIEMMKGCLSHKDTCHAPEWKKKITTEVDRHTLALSQ